MFKKINLKIQQVNQLIVMGENRPQKEVKMKIHIRFKTVK